MSEYIVKGVDETVENVDILGEVRKVGDVVELAPEVAAPLVEEGKLELKAEGGEGSGGGEGAGGDAGAGGSGTGAADTAAGGGDNANGAGVAA